MRLRIAVLALALVVPSGGCLQAIWGYAGIEARPPFIVPIYDGRTELDLRQNPPEQATPPTEREPTFEVHRFQAPDDGINLTVLVSVEMLLPARLAEASGQHVRVELWGPHGEHEQVRFHTTGGTIWRFDGSAAGSWRVIVEGEGAGSVGVAAFVRTGQPGF